MKITQDEFIEKLLKLMKDNSDVPVKCMVDSEIVAEDGYAWWLGNLNTDIEPELREYSTEINDSICFKDDEEYDDWFDCLNLYDTYDSYNIPDSEWDAFVETCVNKEVNWKTAIFVSVTV